MPCLYHNFIIVQRSASSCIININVLTKPMLGKPFKSTDRAYKLGKINPPDTTNYKKITLLNKSIFFWMNIWIDGVEGLGKSKE